MTLSRRTLFALIPAAVAYVTTRAGSDAFPGRTRIIRHGRTEKWKSENPEKWRELELDVTFADPLLDEALK